MNIRSALGIGLLASSVVAVTGVGASASVSGSAPQQDTVKHITVMKARYDEGVTPNISASPSKVAAPSIPLFHQTVTDGATTFPYTMVGKDPFKDLTNGAVDVKTVIVPVIAVFPGGDTFDPTVADSCAPSSSITRLLKSPVFKNKAYTWGGTSVGTGQFASVFRRAEFFNQTKPTGLNPDLQVNLVPTTTTPITVNVPVSAAAEGTLSCGPLGAMEIGWWDHKVQAGLMPKLAARGFGSGTFPIFMLSNVVEYEGVPANCCILGYHNAFTNPADGGTTTYSTSMYDNTHNGFTGVKDISTVSHEVAEWMDDPLVDGVNNNTKPWGHIGQVSGCQSNLEVGDPLSGHLQPTALGGKTWHPQELAFFSWFYHQSASTGVNGWFSSNGTFTADADPCV